jgi:vacuolar-type H+-ATPase subunit E/Vma4
MKARSDMAARQLYSEELEARMSDAFDWLKKGLPDYAKTKSYTALLKKLASMASEELGEGCRLIVKKEDLPKLKGVRGAEAGGDNKSAGGLVGVSADGKRYIDFTLETLLEEMRDRMEVRFVKEIEG